MIRQATKQDLEAIVFIHSSCFADSFSSQLRRFNCLLGGGNLLESFYTEYLDDCPELFIVAEDENKTVVGFCMGYYMDNNGQIQRFVRKNKFRLIWKSFFLLLLGNRPTWQKALTWVNRKTHADDWIIVNEKYESILDNCRGDLLSICVLPEHRGKGYAQAMMEKFLEVMKDHGRQLCLLSAKTDNYIARRFYERNGFEIYRRRGEEGLTYIKQL